MMYPVLAQQSIAELPPVAHIIVGLGLGVGLVLWLFGQRLLRPMFGALGAVLGSLLGFFLLPSALPETLFDVPSPYIGAAAGGILGLIVGVLIFRFAMGVGMAVVGGIAGLLIMGAALNSEPINNAAATARGSVPNQEVIREAGLQLNPLSTQDLQTAAAPIAAQVEEFLKEKLAEIQTAWSEVPRQEQSRLGLAGLAGVFGGLCVGLLMPRRSAAACTAFLGAAIWLPAFAWILLALEAPGRQFLDQKGVVWLVAWVLLSILGLAVQVMGARKSKKSED